jgi:hypothetical protein
MLGPRQNRYFVLYPSQSILPKFLVEGIYYEDAKTRILPCKAIEGQGKIIRLNLSDIPIVEKAEIISKLTESSSKFGTLLDLGLTHESTMGWFMGSGYAIIQQDDKHSYPTRHHKTSIATSTCPRISGQSSGPSPSPTTYAISGGVYLSTRSPQGQDWSNSICPKYQHQHAQYVKNSLKTTIIWLSRAPLRNNFGSKPCPKPAHHFLPRRSGTLLLSWQCPEPRKRSTPKQRP